MEHFNSVGFFDRMTQKSIIDLYSSQPDDFSEDENSLGEYFRKLERDGFGILFDQESGKYVHLYLSDLINFFKLLDCKPRFYCINGDHHIMVFSSERGGPHSSYVIVDSVVDKMPLKIKKEDVLLEGSVQVFHSEWELVEESYKKLIEIKDIKKLPNNRINQNFENLLNYICCDTALYIT